jgi:hypothetical protein
MTLPPDLTIPKAIYLDANALIASPMNLATQPLAELVETAGMLGTLLLIPEVAANEWLANCRKTALEQRRKALGNVIALSASLELGDIKIEGLPEEYQLIQQINDIQMRRLRQTGLALVPTPTLEVAPLIDMFVAKAPPFIDGDKGFKDAVILETIEQHACRDNTLDHILVVSSDKVFAHTVVSSRFTAAGTTLHVVCGAPKDLIGAATECLKGMISDAQVQIFTHRAKRATDFAKKHEAEILAFVRTNAEISMSLVKGYRLRNVMREKDENDEILKYARILSIDGFRPLAVVSAFGYPSLERTPKDGRKSFLITVEVEFDLTIAETNLFSEPYVPVDQIASLTAEQSQWRYPQTERQLTVTRQISVSGSVSEDGFDQDDFDDLRLEMAY